jgi:hypothetical protein
MRILLIVHRYLGIVIGLVMALWCLSGFVMMYRGFPAVTPAQRLAGLKPLDLGRIAANPDLGPAPIEDFRIEMLADRPVLRLATEDGRQTIDLGTGAPIERIGAAEAATVATRFASGQGVVSDRSETDMITHDQWTVEGASRRGLLYRVALGDPAGTVVYVASRTGQVVQATNRSSRLWAWLGAVPHWLYPHVLRQHAALWSQVVIWTSLTGVFLTLTGLYVGVSRLGRGRDGRWSPYRGWRFWHHMAGLFFGLFTLTWVTSGLLTMNPAGLLESSASETQQAALSGWIRPADLQRYLAAAPHALSPGAAMLEAAPLGGRLFVIETFKDGRTQRLDATGKPAPLSRVEVAMALAAAGDKVADLRLMRSPDAYYYPDYDGPAPLPVWKATVAGPGGRVAYLDPVSGQVRLALDGEARASRWIRTGLHDLDFPGLRQRPVWDVVVLLLLAGVTTGAITGAWLGLKRLVWDLKRLSWRLGPRRS